MCYITKVVYNMLYNTSQPSRCSQPDKKLCKIANYVNYAYYAYYSFYYVVCATWPPFALIFLQHGDVCTFMQFPPLSSLETHEKSNRTLQNHTVSILSWKVPKGVPGGRIKTQSWRLVFLSFLDANGQHSTRCSPGNRLCPIWRDEYSLRWPSDRTELISSSVSRRLLIWNNAYYAFYVNYALYSNNAGVYQYKQK